MIKLVGLTKYFDKLMVLEGISYEIPEGESLAVIGPSGCGKSTLLRLLMRLDTPTAGKILIDNRELGKLGLEEVTKLRKRIGMIFQSSALFDSMNVFDNVAFGLRQHGEHSKKDLERIVAEKLEMVELKGTEDMMPDELSGGMQKRVSIARALAFNPSIILYDEPTTGLDPITSVTIENLMIKLKRELKVTSVIVTHVMQTVNRVAEKIVLLHEGKFIECGTPEETSRSGNPVVKRFITGGL